MNKFNLPQPLIPYEKSIKATEIPVVRIQLTREETTLFQSKFGGFPYLPKGQAYPIDEAGNALFLLAQINCEDVPFQANYPKTGILQFFVSLEDELLGLDFNDLTNQQNFRVIYHEHIVRDEVALVTDFSHLHYIQEDAPFKGEFTLTFTTDTEPIPYSDYRFDQAFDGIIDWEQEIDGEQLIEFYAEYTSGGGHKMAGYPYFTQMDVRDNEISYADHQILLLQIDTDDENSIMWGDAGVMNFFIREDDLKVCDFSNVLYTWDCH